MIFVSSCWHPIAQLSRFWRLSSSPSLAIFSGFGGGKKRRIVSSFLFLINEKTISHFFFQRRLHVCELTKHCLLVKIFFFLQEDQFFVRLLLPRWHEDLQEMLYHLTYSAMVWKLATSTTTTFLVLYQLDRAAQERVAEAAAQASLRRPSITPR